MPAPPLVSVAMAMRNAAASIALALQSLIDQSFADWELVLLDDGSSDASVAVARHFADPRILIRADGRSLGLAARLNEAVAAARGRYIARMDADDVAYPERFARQVAFLEQHPEVDLLGTGAIIFDHAGQVIGQLPLRTSHREIATHPWQGYYLAHPTWMGRSGWFRQYPYDTRLSKAQDYDVLLRSHAASCFAGLPELLLGYRQESLSLGKILATRMQLAQAALRHGKTCGHYVRPLFAAAQQAAKFGVDALAIATGLHYRMLRHRALPVASRQREEWLQLWQKLNRESSERCAA
ncbi:MAG: glycosyltransferase [Proteobacteria bacterium]|nr:glycosyltransferase [Pseudomonadota bacterium]